MMGAPLPSSFATLDLMWTGPPHSAKDLRYMKAHLDSGGSVHVRLVTDKETLTATVIGQTNTSQPRANEAGLLLQVELVRSNTPNELELLIHLLRQVYIARTDEDHLTVPTIHRYAVAAQTLTHVSTYAQLVWRNGLISRILYGLYYGLATATKCTAYFPAQGN